jgi:hypothetical protein
MTKELKTLPQINKRIDFWKTRLKHYEDLKTTPTYTGKPRGIVLHGERMLFAEEIDEKVEVCTYCIRGLTRMKRKIKK